MSDSRFIEFTEYITPDGVTYNFDSADRFLMSETGLGMPPIEYITTRGPFQHGETVVDYRLGVRTIQLIHRANACSRATYWANRATLVDMLRPNRQSIGNILPGTLQKTFQDGSRRCLKVLIEEGPRFEPRELDRWDEWGFQETLRFIAHDPVFYDPTAVSWAFTLSTTNQLVLPFSLPFTLDPAGIDNTLAITYTGTWLVYPTITIVGPLAGPVITNNTTGHTLHLVYGVAQGETVTITTAYGAKGVTNQDGDNLIGTLTADSDLADFHIAPAPEATGGVNTLRVVGSNALVGTTAVVVSYYTRYIGL